MENTITFRLNFGGFYNSCLEESINNNLDFMEKSIEDWSALILEVSKVYLDSFSESLFYASDLKKTPNLKFVSLYSPRYYNFETDVIICSISLSDLRALLRIIERSKLIEYIEENTKSYDGYISFYSGFSEVKKDLEIFTQFLFDYLIETYDLTQSKILQEDELYLNESIMNLVEDYSYISD